MRKENHSFLITLKFKTKYVNSISIHLLNKKSKKHF